jgi:catechol 2,3-dioxygenase-like lactoylglutathione lyase family enzyme
VTRIESMSPFFIVSDVSRSMAFYCDTLGFEVQFSQPESKPFFALVARDGAMLFLKSGVAPPLPNPRRDPEMRWDAYCFAPDPDALATELAGRGAAFSKPLRDTSDGLRGFEISDPDGYVLFFGHPRRK